MMNLLKTATFLVIFSALAAVIFAQTNPPQRTFLKGIFTARPGTVIELVNNNDEVLTVTAGNDGNTIFSRNSFSFIIRYVVGANYLVSIKNSPTGQVCSIYANSEGSVRENVNELRVGCDTAELVSRSTDNRSFGTFYDSTAPVISGSSDEEGRYIAFSSTAAGLGGTTGKFRQIIWRDRNTGESKIVSVSPAGEEGNQNSLAPAISADGKSVAFESYASNLVSGDSNGARDVFIWSERAGKVERVSTGLGGLEANYQSYEPTISGDGSLVAFTSDASNLIPNILGISSTNVYLKDTRSGALQIISIDEKTKKGGGGSNPSISEDGRRIAFYNYAPLVPDDKNNLWDIYVWESGNPKLKRISKTSTGGERNQGDESTSRVVAPSISGNGRFVSFATTATNVVTGDTNSFQDAFVVEVDSGRVVRVSGRSDGIQGDGDSPIGQGEKIAISYDGNWVAFSTNAKSHGGKIVMKNILTGEARVIVPQPSYGVGPPAISRGGGYVIFGSADRLDSRYQSTGIFAAFTGTARCRFCPQ
ncbi:MAG: TolB family protein [Pyrinomonadaceae bacterium]